MQTSTGGSFASAGRFLRLAMALGIGASVASTRAGAGDSWEILRSGQAPVAEVVEFGDTMVARPVDHDGVVFTRVGAGDWVAAPVEYLEARGPVSVTSLAAFGGHFSLLGSCSIPDTPWDTSGEVLGTSADGLGWETQLAHQGTAYIHGYLYMKATGGRLLVFGGEGNSSGFGALGYSSEDGISWTRFEMHGPSTPIHDVCGEGPVFVAGGGGETPYGSRCSIMVSTNGVDWTATYTVPSEGYAGSFRRVGWGNGTYVAVIDFPGVAWLSPDGLTGQWVSIPFTSWGWHPPRRLLFGAGRFLLFYAFADAESPLMLGTSADGREWTRQTWVESEGIHDVAFGGGRFIAVGEQGRVMTSRDGLTWKTHEAPTTEVLDWVGPGERGFLIAGQSEVLMRFVPAPEVRLSIRAGQGIEVQVSGDAGVDGELQTSSSLSPLGAWQPVATFVLGEESWVRSFPNSGEARFFRAVLDP
ncbi:MAG: hypothetical protein H7A46_18005 [Verrucomicrobiales bacterium]|nr:hypothetical protein [Verrucomicrobiales bacterium]